MKLQIGDLLIIKDIARILIVNVDYHCGKELLIGLNDDGTVYPFGFTDGTLQMIQRGEWQHFPVKV